MWLIFLWGLLLIHATSAFLYFYCPFRHVLELDKVHTSLFMVELLFSRSFAAVP